MDEIKGASLLASGPQSNSNTIMVLLPPELGARLELPIKGQGGWQTLLAQIKSQTYKANDSYILQVSPGLLQTMIAASLKHGQGGYQSLIRWILCVYLRETQGEIV